MAGNTVIYICVKEVKDHCAAGYKPGDIIIVERFYIKPLQKVKICLHALNAMLTFLVPLLKGISASELGIGKEEAIGYVQCPDPGTPYTCGGTVVFELKRKIE